LLVGNCINFYGIEKLPRVVWAAKHLLNFIYVFRNKELRNGCFCTYNEIMIDPGGLNESKSL